MSSTVLTESDCFEVIERTLNSHNWKMSGFKLRPLAKISGFLGNHCTLQVSVLCEGVMKELSFFVKAMTLTEVLKQFMLTGGAFYKEEKMFTKMIPHLLENGITVINDCVPKCYLVRTMEFFVFEDLSSMGYKVLKHRESLNLQEVKLAIKAISKFNASGLILEEEMTRKLQTTYRLSTDYDTEFRESFYFRHGSGLKFLESAIAGTLALVDFFGSDLETDIQRFKKFISNTISRYPEFVASSNKFRNTICHGDLWSMNFMYKFEAGGDIAIHCKLIDFQSYRYNPPGQEIMNFLYLTTDRNFRSTYAHQILQYYYDELRLTLENYGINMNDVVSYEEYQASCEHYEMFSTIQAVTHFEVIMMPTEELEEFFVDQENVRKTMFEDRTDMLIMMCKKYPSYRQKQFESLIELRDVYEKLSKKT